jgi:hypothetical protein
MTVTISKHDLLVKPTVWPDSILQRSLLLLIVLMSFLDIITTGFGILRFGVGIESNPIVRWIFEQTLDVGVGVIYFTFFKIFLLSFHFITIGYLYSLMRKSGIIVAAILLIILSVVVLNNFIGLFLHL